MTYKNKGGMKITGQTDLRALQQQVRHITVEAQAYAQVVRSLQQELTQKINELDQARHLAAQGTLVDNRILARMQEDITDLKLVLFAAHNDLVQMQHAVDLAEDKLDMEYEVFVQTGRRF